MRRRIQYLIMACALLTAGVCRAQHVTAETAVTKNSRIVMSEAMRMIIGGCQYSFSLEAGGCCADQSWYLVVDAPYNISKAQTVTFMLGNGRRMVLVAETADSLVAKRQPVRLYGKKTRSNIYRYRYKLEGDRLDALTGIPVRNIRIDNPVSWSETDLDSSDSESLMTFLDKARKEVIKGRQTLTAHVTE